jgi:TPR repeat protein
MPRRSKRIKTATQSGGVIGNLPRSIVVHVLKFFDIHEVARLQRLVCREFRDAGQERIRERGGRKLFEEGIAYFRGHDHMPMDKARGRLLLDASIGAGCRLEELSVRMNEDDLSTPLVLNEDNLSDEEKQKILKDLKEIATKSPYHWVDYYIGLWYKIGFGGETNKSQAVVWYLKAINGGNAHAMYRLAVAYDYEDGNLGLTQSDTKANEFYALAAEKGHAVARFNLGYNYKNGIGVDNDFVRCFELWEQCAKQGHAKAQYTLSDLYKDGSLDNENGNPMTIPKNLPLHFKWAFAAAKHDHVGGQAYTGRCYDQGLGVERDYASAFEWYRKAAEQENRFAQYRVGRMFEYGRGRDIDLIQALFWYRKAATQGWQHAANAVERLA